TAHNGSSRMSPCGTLVTQDYLLCDFHLPIFELSLLAGLVRYRSYSSVITEDVSRRSLCSVARCARPILSPLKESSPRGIYPERNRKTPAQLQGYLRQYVLTSFFSFRVLFCTYLGTTPTAQRGASINKSKVRLSILDFRRPRRYEKE